ncbi:219_t:CDS:1, partial [Dentiscutata erythropus]
IPTTKSERTFGDRIALSSTGHPAFVLDTISRPKIIQPEKIEPCVWTE